MRIVFIGSVEFSRITLEHLIAMRAEIVGVCTLAASAFNADHFDLSGICKKNNIFCLQVDDINSDRSVEWITARQPDIIFCFGWSKLLKTKLLSVPPMGVVGFHPAALPSNRGRHPIIWALALGLESTASTFFFMNSGADTGDILSQYPIKIDPIDTAATLYKKISQTALQQLNDFLPKLINGSYLRQPQDVTRGNTWRKRTIVDGCIDWRMSAITIHNLVRALTKPYVGAHFVYKNNQIKLWKTSVIDDVPNNVEPGIVLGNKNLDPIIKCGEKAICLHENELVLKLQIGEYL